MGALYEAPIAGPDETFRLAVYSALAATVAEQGSTDDDEIDELIRLYRDEGPAGPNARRPLPAEDRTPLRRAIEYFQKYRQHPLLPFQKPTPKLELAFLTEGWAKPSREPSGDLNPADVLLIYMKAKVALQRFAFRHMALRRVAEVCAVHQRKWALAGEVATLDVDGLRRAVAALLDRHLLLREADGALNVHPAVRDYFAGKMASEEQGGWHEVIGEQLVSLAQRPGVRRPEDKATLDLLEDAIHHLLGAGRSAEAARLYNVVLGGHRHLAWKLGESARGFRILRSFRPCPDRWALGWYLRALGELDAAYEQTNLAYFRADIRLLQGRLAEVAEEGDSARSTFADALRGGPIPGDDPLGLAIPRAQLLLYQGRLTEAWQALPPDRLYQAIGWEGDRARGRLIQAEVARRMGDLARARRALDEATSWVLHSGSVEHLALYHLVRARLLRDDGDPQSARRAVDEGLHFARQSGLGLYHIELLCVQAETSLNSDNPAAAQSAARRACELAASPECGFLWGIAEAHHLLGHSLVAQRRLGEARSVLRPALELRRQLGDPRAVEQTERLLALVP